MKIIVLDGGTLNPGDISWTPIHELGELQVYEQSSIDRIVERSLDADIIIVNKVPITADVISQLPNLKYIAVSATGYNNIDMAACANRGILVSNVKDYGSSNVAQHVFALILALTNRVESHYQSVLKGKWQDSNAFSFWDVSIIELAKKTIGIIGWGNIGQKVGRIANGFEMNVLFSSKSQPSCDWAERVTMDELLSRSDIISINTQLTNKNAEMVNAEFLNRMKPNALLINTSRGALINEVDLATALRSGTIAGAGLDVLSVEPPSADHRLLHIENCVVTPHNAWASVEARQRLMNIMANNIRSYIEGHPDNLVT